MRKTPFRFSEPENLTEENTNSKHPAEEVTDISEILKRRPTTKPAPEPERTHATPDPQPERDGAPEAEEPKAKASADFDNEEPKKENPIAGLIDPAGMARTIVDIANMGREFFYPSVYDKYFFTPFELQDLDALKRKQRDKLKKNEALDTNDYEKMLLDKERELLKYKLKISLSESERKLLADKLARHLEKIDWMKRLEQYDWILVLLAIEGVRFMELKQGKKKFDA